MPPCHPQPQTSQCTAAQCIEQSGRRQQNLLAPCRTYWRSLPQACLMLDTILSQLNKSNSTTASPQHTNTFHTGCCPCCGTHTLDCNRSQHKYLAPRPNLNAEIAPAHRALVRVVGGPVGLRAQGGRHRISCTLGQIPQPCHLKHASKDAE